MKKTRIALSFDDGRKDNYDIALNILKKRRIPATFNITTAYVDGTISSDDRPCIIDSMTIKNVVDLAKLGFEIAGHGDHHKNSLEDMGVGLIKLRDWLCYPCNQRFGAASPNSNLTERDVLAKKEEWDNIGVSYVRTGIRSAECFYMRVIRKLAYLTKSTYLYKKGFQASLEVVSDQFVLHSIPVMNRTTVNQVKTIISEAIYQQKDCILMFHSIVSEGNPYFNDTWSWDRKKFNELCEWLVEMSSKSKIQLLTIGDLIIKEEKYDFGNTASIMETDFSKK